MRKIREVLRFRYAGRLSVRTIATSLELASSTVDDYLKRAEKAGLQWPLPEGISDADLESRLFTKPQQTAAPRTPPDCERIHNELRAHKDVSLTRYQLWTEYREANPDGYEYSRFCDYYRAWLDRRDLCMRQEHAAGEKCFVDYRKGPCIVDRETGELIETQLFIWVWGASNFTYAEATLTQTLPDWTSSHARAYEYSGCAPRVLVPDCLKSGVTKASLYESEANQTYAEMAAHYGSVIVPARPLHPKDKAKAECGVLVSVRWILAVLRHETFFSLGELNAAIAKQLERLNTRPMRKLKKSRREIFETVDRPAALKLPATAYEYAEWKKAGVGRDYRIKVGDQTYSVPHRLVRQNVDVRVTANTVEAFHKGERVAAHVRSRVAHSDTFLTEHMPPAHQKYAGWTRERVLEWGAGIGPSTATLVGMIMDTKPHRELGLSSCFGILKLANKFGRDRLEAAAQRALKYNAYNYGVVHNILIKGLDRVPEAPARSSVTQLPLPLNRNVRGKEYYH